MWSVVCGVMVCVCNGLILEYVLCPVLLCSSMGVVCNVLLWCDVWVILVDIVWGWYGKCYVVSCCVVCVLI